MIDRDVCRPEHEPSGARASVGDGLLAERQAVSARRHAEHGPDRAFDCAVDRHRCQRHRAHQRVHRRRLRQPYSGLHRDGDSGAAVEEAQWRAGDDAHHPRRRALHRPRPSRAACAAPRSASRRTAASPRSISSSMPTTVPTTQSATAASAGDVISLAYQPKTMRWRGLAVLTNTPPRGAQRAPGGMQGIAIMEPIIAKAARTAECRSSRNPQDQRALLARRRLVRPAPRGARQYVTSAFVKEALDKGARAVQLGREEGAQRTAAGHEGPRLPASPSAPTRPARIGFDGSAHHQAGRSRAVPVRHRQSGHARDHRRASGRGRDARRAVGKVRCRLGQHLQAPALELCIRRQPDDARDDTRRARRRH